jgi:metal-responsive CopG/Arc/MetJ family transcriptional regulator
VKHLIDQPVRVRTTVDLPRDLLDRSRSVVDRGLAKNQSTLFTAAIADYLDQIDQQAIDSQFATMASDDSYQELNLHLLNEFAGNDKQAQAARDESP